MYIKALYLNKKSVMHVYSIDGIMHSGSDTGKEVVIVLSNDAVYKLNAVNFRNFVDSGMAEESCGRLISSEPSCYATAVYEGCNVWKKHFNHWNSSWGGLKDIRLLNCITNGEYFFVNFTEGYAVLEKAAVGNGLLTVMDVKFVPIIEYLQSLDTHNGIRLRVHGVKDKRKCEGMNRAYMDKYNFSINHNSWIEARGYDFTFKDKKLQSVASNLLSNLKWRNVTLQQVVDIAGKESGNTKWESGKMKFLSYSCKRMERNKYENIYIRDSQAFTFTNLLEGTNMTMDINGLKKLNKAVHPSYVKLDTIFFSRGTSSFDSVALVLNRGMDFKNDLNMLYITAKFMIERNDIAIGNSMVSVIWIYDGTDVLEVLLINNKVADIGRTRCRDKAKNLCSAFYIGSYVCIHTELGSFILKETEDGLKFCCNAKCTVKTNGDFFVLRMKLDSNMVWCYEGSGFSSQNFMVFGIRGIALGVWQDSRCYGINIFSHNGVVLLQLDDKVVTLKDGGTSVDHVLNGYEVLGMNNGRVMLVAHSSSSVVELSHIIKNKWYMNEKELNDFVLTSSDMFTKICNMCMSVCNE